MSKKGIIGLGYGNARMAAMFTVDGITDTLSGWASRLGISYLTLYKRICMYGKTPEEAIRAGNRHMWRTYITINGETHTIAEWGRKTGINPDNISERMSRNGWSPEEALGFKPHVNKAVKNITYHGKTRTIAQWATELGISYSAMRGRIKLHSEGRLSRRAVFMKGELNPWRIVRKVKSQNWYRGKRLTLDEIAKRKGCNKRQISDWFRAGYSATQILNNAALVPCRDTNERIRRRVESYYRNRHLRELRHLGLLV